MPKQARVFLSMLHETCEGVGPHDEHGVAQGLWTFFAADGSRQAEGFLADGEPHGTWRVWAGPLAPRLCASRATSCQLHIHSKHAMNCSSTDSVALPCAASRPSKSAEGSERRA